MADMTRTGTIYNIQRYSIHDGPGIRTTVFLKGCPLSCYWCHNPESQRVQPELFLNREKCTSCGRCVSACANNANSLVYQTGIQLNRKACNGCGRCIDACPAGARTLMGKQATVDDVLTTVLRDKKYYISSKQGGVTVSGGEPSAQPEFTREILKACKENGIHTLLETCGFATWETLGSILEYVDMVYYDIKCINSLLHQKGTGVDNALILENAIKASKICKMLVRVPVIPKFNDDPYELRKIAEFARDKLGHNEIELLKYNKLAQSKYIRLDRPFLGETETPPNQEMNAHMDQLRNMIKSEFQVAKE